MTNTRPVYKKSVATDRFVEIGIVDECGYIDLTVLNYRVVDKPSSYYPEFYTDVETERVITGQKTIRNAEGEEIGKKTVSVGRYVSSVDKKAFIPKNIPQQTISLVGSVLLKPEEYYVTGYVTDDGRAVYYDQFIESK